MIKHILRIIWNQRSGNGWVFAELLVVAAVLWTMIDSLLVDAYTYYTPLGIQIDNVYTVTIGKMDPSIAAYVPDSAKATSDGEDLIRLADNLKRSPLVVEACLSATSCPYTWSSSWTSVVPAEETDTTVKVNSFQRMMVTPSYFDVFRVKAKDGQPLRRVVEGSVGEVVLSADMEAKFFGAQSAVGRKLKWSVTNEPGVTVAAVSSPIRQNEYQKSEPCFYMMMRTDEEVVETVRGRMAQNMDCMIRMKDGFRPEEMESFLQGMSDRLTVNNLYVSSVTPLTNFRDMMLKERQDNMKKKIALVGFMLVNVFFGIVGTFWLRTQYRRGEMGLRVALGSSRSRLRRFMNVEGISLLSFTAPLVLMFIVNVLYADLPDTVRLPYTWWRFAIAFGGTFLLLGTMIIVGIWLPARQITRMDLAEALRYE